MPVPNKSCTNKTDFQTLTDQRDKTTVHGGIKTVEKNKYTTTGVIPVRRSPRLYNISSRQQ